MRWMKGEPEFYTPANVRSGGRRRSQSRLIGTMDMSEEEIAGEVSQSFLGKVARGVLCHYEWALSAKHRARAGKVLLAKYVLHGHGLDGQRAGT